MQTKSSYRVLKWTFLTGVTLMMASACVVSSGDGNDDDTDINEGGDGGTKTTGGTPSAGTGGTSAGTSNGGTTTSNGGSADGGTPATNEGGTPSGFVPGECQVNEALQPASLPVCDAATGDSDCIKCIKLQACDEYKTCFGEEPATACSVGMTAGADGQFACVEKCFKAGAAAATDADELLTECSAQCDECNSGGLNDETFTLIDVANKPGTCQEECFPF